MTAPETFTLSPGDRANPLWPKLRGFLEKRLASARLRNDGPLPEEETWRIRGQIIELKALLRLDEDLPPMDGDGGGAP